MKGIDNNKTFSEGFKKVLSMFLRYGNKKRSPYSAEEFRAVTTQFRKDKEEYLTRKTNPSRYTDERVINALKLSYELEKKYYSQKV